MPDKFDVKDTGQREQFNTGSKRETGDKERFDFISFIGMWRLSIHLAKGAKKYGEHNWALGQPTSRLFASAFRHLMWAMMGKKDEDHLMACVFNLFSIAHVEYWIEQGELDESLDDFAYGQSPHLLRRRMEQEQQDYEPGFDDGTYDEPYNSLFNYPVDDDLPF